MYITINGSSVRECMRKLNEQIPKTAVIKRLVSKQQRGKATVQCYIEK